MLIIKHSSMSNFKKRSCHLAKDYHSMTAYTSISILNLTNASILCVVLFSLLPRGRAKKKYPDVFMSGGNIFDHSASKS